MKRVEVMFPQSFITPAQKLLLSRARVNKFLRGNKQFPHVCWTPFSPLPHRPIGIIPLSILWASRRPYVFTADLRNMHGMRKMPAFMRISLRSHTRLRIEATHFRIAFDVMPMHAPRRKRTAPATPTAGERRKEYFSIGPSPDSESTGINPSSAPSHELARLRRMHQTRTIHDVTKNAM